MAPSQRWRSPASTLFLYLSLAILTSAQQTYYFSGAVQVWTSSSGSAAVPATCPADHPVSCSAISEPYYCCPANNVCAWSSSQVACCPVGSTCTAQYAPVAGQGGYQPLSSTTTTAFVAVAAPTTAVVYVAVTTTTGQGGAVGGGYCSTQTVVGPNLPTTAQGQCGTILLVAGAEGRAKLGWWWGPWLGVGTLGVVVMWW